MLMLKCTLVEIEKLLWQMGGETLSGSRTKFEVSLQAEVYNVATIHNIQKMLLFVHCTKNQRKHRKLKLRYFSITEKMFLWLH